MSTTFPHTLPLRSAEASASGQGKQQNILAASSLAGGSSLVWRPGYPGSGFCWVLLRDVTPFPGFVAEVPDTKLDRVSQAFGAGHHSVYSPSTLLGLVSLQTFPSV